MLTESPKPTLRLFGKDAPTFQVSPRAVESFLRVGAPCRAHKEKRAVQFEPPLEDVASKMPLLIFRYKKYTNIPEVNGKNRTIFLKFKGDKNILY